MGKRGPKPRPDQGNVRKKMVAFRVSEREWDLICETAQAVGMSPLEWARTAVLKWSIKVPAQTDEERVVLHGESVVTQ